MLSTGGSEHKLQKSNAECAKLCKMVCFAHIYTRHSSLYKWLLHLNDKVFNGEANPDFSKAFDKVAL